METIIYTINVKHSDLAKLMLICEIANIRPRVIHVDVEKEETEFYLGPNINIETVSVLLSLDMK